MTYLGDVLGRKRMIFLGSLIAIFGCALQGGAVTIAMLIAGRFFAGIAVGQLSSTVPIYCVSSDMLTLNYFSISANRSLG